MTTAAPAAGTIVEAELDAVLARRSLTDFVKAAWPLVEDVPLVWNWHIDAICEALEAVSAGEIDRLLINVPPGCMKSYLVSVLWPAWEWASHPELRYLTAAYNVELTIRDNLRVRDIVTSPWYRSAYPTRLKEDRNVKVRFETTDRGWRIASSVGGRATGEHPDRIIIDDPLSADQGRSDQYLLTARDWFDRTISTRGVARKVRIVVIMQRLNEEDLAGHLIGKGGWDHICWPMRYDPKRADARDLRSEPGELLWPRLFPETAVRQLEIDLGPYGAAGQLQQAPSPEGGGLFKRAWFTIVDAAPAKADRCRGWDTAGTEDGGDWTVGVKLSRDPDGGWYIEDIIRGQWGPHEVDKTIKQTADIDGVETLIREEQEGGASGKAVVTARARDLAGFDYAGAPVTGDKVTRARPLRAQAEAGNVKLVRGDWNKAFLDEAISFPVGRHDDQIDGASTAFNALVALERKPRGGALW